MGVYYTAYCAERNEFIEPSDLKDQGIKYESVHWGKFASLLVFMLVRRRWPSACMIGDFDPPEGARNVTREAVSEYNAACEFTEDRIFLNQWAV